MLSRIKFEIEPLVKEMLDQLPASVWANDTTTFFDPAIGGGQFVRHLAPAGGRGLRHPLHQPQAG